LYFDFLSILLAVRDDDHYGQSRVQGERGRWIIIARSLGEIASIPSLKNFSGQPIFQFLILPMGGVLERRNHKTRNNGCLRKFDITSSRNKTEISKSRERMKRDLGSKCLFKENR
jgi:hypothetical protein